MVIGCFVVATGGGDGGGTAVGVKRKKISSFKSYDHL